MARIITFSIQSGSNGNCIYVEAGDRRLLFDAGVSGRVARQRMAEHGRDPADCDALIISHDHSDHVRGAGVFQRMFGLPVYLTRRTRAAIRGDLGRLDDVRYFATGDTLELGAVRVHTASTPHDAADGAVFVVEYAGARLGIFTDLGHVFCGLDGLLDSVDAAYLESNYDVDMLLDGPYPYYLKRRITGHGGTPVPTSMRPSWCAARSAGGTSGSRWPISVGKTTIRTWPWTPTARSSAGLYLAGSARGIGFPRSTRWRRPRCRPDSGNWQTPDARGCDVRSIGGGGFQRGPSAAAGGRFPWNPRTGTIGTSPRPSRATGWTGSDCWSISWPPKRDCARWWGVCTIPI
jgi:phosphoribosyl 1,2-cyclic phosphodiesterase